MRNFARGATVLALATLTTALTAQDMTYRLQFAICTAQGELKELAGNRVGYDVGVRTSIDVLNAQQQLFSAKRDLLQARYGYLVNIIRLKAASGVIVETDLADINQQLVLR